MVQKAYAHLLMVLVLFLVYNFNDDLTFYYRCIKKIFSDTFVIFIFFPCLLMNMHVNCNDTKMQLFFFFFLPPVKVG